MLLRSLRRLGRESLRDIRRLASSTTRNAVRGVEPMEPRLLLSVQPVQVGAVYIEEDLGSDLHGDTLVVTFQGGAPGTQLQRLLISGDQNAPGFNAGDVFFDTVESHTGSGHASLRG